MMRKDRGWLGRFCGWLALAAALLILWATRMRALTLQEATWAFEPQTWVRSNDVTCRAWATDTLGLRDMARYRYTTSGAASIAFAPWITAGLEIGGAISTTKIITVTHLALPDSMDQNWIQFLVTTTNDITRTSEVFRILVDATPPQNPTTVSSGSHTIARWSNDSTIDIAWSGETDATSGVWGYRYEFDTSPLTLPPPVENWTGSEVTSAPLADGNSHYFHLRTRDNAGNWAPDAVHSGPYFIDTTPPTNPTTLTSPSHTPGVWSKDNTIEVSWNPGSDGLSGVAGYSVLWNHASDTLPDTITETILGFHISPVMTDSDKIWFHLRTVDRARNGSDSSLHLGPFLVDTSPPWNPTTFVSSHITDTWSNRTTITMSWSGAGDAGSGVAGYAIRWDALPFTVPDPVVVTTDTTSSISGLAHGSRNYFHLRTGDQQGNWSDAVHLGPFLIDTQPPTPPSGLSVEPAGWTNVDSFTVRWKRNPPDTSGIGGAYCKLDDPPLGPTDYYTYTRGNDVKEISGISVGQDGIHDVYIWLEDRAGNSDYELGHFPLIDAFHLDRVAPQSSHRLDRDPDHNGWYTDTVTVYLFAQDPIPPEANAVSRVAVISYTIDGGPLRSYSELGFPVGGEGEHVIRYFAVDHAGNREITHTLAPRIKIDLEPPQSYVMDVTGIPGQGGWWLSPVQVVLGTVADQGSRVMEIWHRYRRNDGDWSAWAQGNTFTLDQEGIYAIQHYAVDEAGHREAVQDMEGFIYVDLADPITQHTLAGTEGQNGWYVASPVAVVLLPSDSMSGVRETRYLVDGDIWRVWNGTPFTVSGEGLHTVEYYSLDIAGNEEAIKRFHVGIDSQPPTMVGLPQVTPAETWHNRPDFVISWTSPPQEQSGVVGVYYKFNDVPRANHDYDGFCLDTQIITRCANVAPPGEGRHGIAIWLSDMAGNIDYTTRRYLPDTIWYDATPPGTTVSAEGTGEGLWYNSPVTLTFQATDPIPPGVNDVSGVQVTSYSVGCGLVWQAGNQAVITDEGRTTVCFRSRDRAGNTEQTRQVSLRIDRTPPPAASNVTVAPTGWSAEPRFTLSWTNPSDVSGIAGAYYAHGLPSAPEDGHLIPNSSSNHCPGNCSAEVVVPGEGQWDLYLWLKDGAGNSNWTTPYHLAGAFRYDATPPTASHTLVGTKGRLNWWLSPVQISLQTSDNASGVVQVRYRLRQPPTYAWEEWHVYAGPFTLSRDGASDVRYYAIDGAGNWGEVREFTAEIDTRPPFAHLNPLPLEIGSPTPRVSFPVTWEGSDPAPGSGLAGFGVQYKDGVDSTWGYWITGTLDRNATFEGTPGHVYYFRASARDVAGNSGGFSGSAMYGSTRTFVQSVVNGDFGTPAFTGWEHGGVLWARQVVTLSHEGLLKTVTLLGQPELKRGYNERNEGITPIGYGAITQTITIPPLEDLADPVLSFWYRVFSYDVVWSGDPSNQTLYDSFDVHILTPGGSELLVRDGNYGPFADDVPVVDTGWKEKRYSLAAYAGRTIQIRFACHNRNDNYYNTWAYVDEVRVSGRFEQRLHLPAILKRR